MHEQPQGIVPTGHDDGHTRHSPATQWFSPVHAVSQLPQCASVPRARFTHSAPHRVNPAAQAPSTHRPSSQCCAPGVQTTPQPPQLSES